MKARLQGYTPQKDEEVSETKKLPMDLSKYHTKSTTYNSKLAAEARKTTEDQKAIERILTEGGTSISPEAKLYAIREAIKNKHSNNLQTLLNSITKPPLNLFELQSYMGDVTQDDAGEVLEVLHNYGLAKVEGFFKNPKEEEFVCDNKGNDQLQNTSNPLPCINPIKLALLLNKPNALKKLLELGYEYPNALKRAKKVGITSNASQVLINYFQEHHPEKPKESSVQRIFKK